jgi:hypothetical protein
MPTVSSDLKKYMDRQPDIQYNKTSSNKQQADFQASYERQNRFQKENCHQSERQKESGHQRKTSPLRGQTDCQKYY